MLSIMFENPLTRGFASRFLQIFIVQYKALTFNEIQLSLFLVKLNFAKHVAQGDVRILFTLLC